MQFPVPSSRRRSDFGRAINSTLVTVTALATAWAALQAFRLLRAKHRRVETAAFSHDYAGSGRRFLVVGDSTGVGIGSVDSRSTVAGRLAAAFPGTVIVNHARDGARSIDIPAQIGASTGHFDLTLVFAGGNDAIRLSSYEAVLLAAEYTLDVASSRSDHVAVVLPADWNCAALGVAA